MYPPAGAKPVAIFVKVSPDSVQPPIARYAFTVPGLAVVELEDARYRIVAARVAPFVVTVNEVNVGGATGGGGVEVTVTGAPPNFVVSCSDVAVILADPVADGVNTPFEVTVPPRADHVTAVLNDPVPVTVDTQAEVCVIEIEVGLHATFTAVIVDGAALTVTGAVPNFVVS